MMSEIKKSDVREPISRESTTTEHGSRELSGTEPKLPPRVTDAELAVLESLWQHGESTIRALTDELYPGGGAARYATVQKLLERLEDKGCTHRRREGRVGIFRATIDRGTLIVRRLEATAERLCGGALTPLFSHLVDAADARDLSDDDLGALRTLVDRLEREREDAE